MLTIYDKFISFKWLHSHDKPVDQSNMIQTIFLMIYIYIYSRRITELESKNKDEVIYDYISH